MEEGDVAAGLAAHALVARQRAVALQSFHATEHRSVSMTALTCWGREHRELRLGAVLGRLCVCVCVFVCVCMHVCLYFFVVFSGA